MKRTILATILTAGFACTAHAGMVSVGFNDFDSSPEFSQANYNNAGSMAPWQKCDGAYNGTSVSISSGSMCVNETKFARDYPDALLASAAVNDSGLLSAYDPLRITAGGEFSLTSVDLMNGLYNIGMGLRFNAFTNGVLTGSLDVLFGTGDASNNAAYIGGQSWLFGVNGAALGVMDTLIITGIAGSRGGNHFFLDNLVVDAANVPEPGTLALFAIGGLGLLARRRRGATAA